MRFHRRNPDEDLRSLERRASDSDENFIRYAAVVLRTRDPHTAQVGNTLIKLRSIWRAEWERIFQLKNTYSSLLPLLAGINVDIFDGCIIDSFDRAQQAYIIVKTMLQDMPPSAGALDIAAWLWDRRQHRGRDRPNQLNIIEPRIPWFSFDTIDNTAYIYRSGVFPAVNALGHWNKLTSLADRHQDPRIYAAARPTTEQAIQYIHEYLADLFGLIPTKPLFVTHGPDLHHTYYSIYILLSDGGSMFLGEVGYELLSDGFHFNRIKFDFNVGY